MRIGELARKAGVSTSRIRFYEESGLLAPAARSSNGYRSYGERDLKIIVFIERAQRLGFSLKEIGAFLGRPPDQRSASTLAPRLEAKLAEIDRHIRDARQRRGELAKLIEELRGGDLPH
jgi:MerR family transcriptional regulator, copper efflux regulator